jgi:hypothetical protein
MSLRLLLALSTFSLLTCALRASDTPAAPSPAPASTGSAALSPAPSLSQPAPSAAASPASSVSSASDGKEVLTPTRSPAPTIWSGVVLATNETHPAPAPAQLDAYSDKIKNIFGYNQLALIGENSQRMEASYEHWLIPSKDFYLSVRSHTKPGEAYPLKIALFQNRHRIADFDARLGADSPLFIRGPMYARGQLIIVLRAIAPPAPAP